MAVLLAIAGDVFDGVLFLCCPFSHEMSWMKSGAEFGEFVIYPIQFLLSTLYVQFLLLQFCQGNAFCDLIYT